MFVPEWPPEEDWPDKLCRKLELERAAGQRLNIVIVSEGAIDRQGQPINCTVLYCTVLYCTGRASPSLPTPSRR